MKKGVSFEMDRHLFVALFDNMRVFLADANHPMRVIAQDFVDRNQAKYDKISNQHDEPIQFAPRETVVRINNSTEQYLVLRARLKTDGKREYWLTHLQNLRDRSNDRLHIDYKVSAKSLSAVGPLSQTLVSRLGQFTRLPKKI